MILSLAIQLLVGMRRYRGAVVDQRPRHLLVDHLVGERRVEHGGVDVAGQQVGHQAAAAERHAREVELVLGQRPAGAGYRVPEPADVMPTFLPASSETFLIGESVFTTRYQP